MYRGEDRKKEREKVRRGDEKVAESGAETNDSGNGEKDADRTKGGLAGSNKIVRKGTTQGDSTLQTWVRRNVLPICAGKCIRRIRFCRNKCVLMTRITIRAL